MISCLPLSSRLPRFRRREKLDRHLRNILYRDHLPQFGPWVLWVKGEGGLPDLELEFALIGRADLGSKIIEPPAHLSATQLTDVHLSKDKDIQLRSFIQFSTGLQVLQGCRDKSPGIMEFALDMTAFVSCSVPGSLMTIPEGIG